MGGLASKQTSSQLVNMTANKHLCVAVSAATHTNQAALFRVLLRELRFPPIDCRQRFEDENGRL